MLQRDEASAHTIGYSVARLVRVRGRVRVGVRVRIRVRFRVRVPSGW